LCLAHGPGPMSFDGPLSAAATPSGAAEAWGGQSPFGLPFFIVTQRPEAGADRRRLQVRKRTDEAALGCEAADGKAVWAMGGADLIRQAMKAG